MPVVVRGSKATYIASLLPGQVVHDEGVVLAGCPRKGCGKTSSWTLPVLQRIARKDQDGNNTVATAKVECAWCGGHVHISLKPRPPLDPTPAPP